LQGSVPSEAVQLFEDPQEGILEDIFGLIGVVDQLQRQVVDQLLIAADDLGFGLPVARYSSSDEVLFRLLVQKCILKPFRAGEV
jgi:hypothetical protein